MNTHRKGVLGAALLALVVGLGGCGGGGGSGTESSGVAQPVLVAELASVTAVATGWAYSCAVDLSGQAWCWGANDYGQLGCNDGSGPFAGHTAPCAVASVTPPMQLASIAASGLETCGLDLAGNAFCWGYGIPSDPLREPIGPTPVDTTERFRLLRGPKGNPGMCGISQSGARYCWGSGETTAERLVPQVQDDSGLQFVDIALGQLSDCGVTTEAEAWCWGSNWFGQLGMGTVGQFDGPLESDVPVKVVGDHSYVAVAAGLMHACALDSEGAAWCWGFIPGDDAYGTPQPVPGDQRFAAIFAGGQFTCGLTNDGKAWCWGWGPFGELGNGSYGTSLEPVAVLGGLYFSTLSLGGVHACGITKDEQLYCWGNNEFGQLGRP
jgi:alpha-tubulin suppressor-like RCC1 family protein